MHPCPNGLLRLLDEPFNEKSVFEVSVIFVNPVAEGGGKERVSLLQTLFFHALCLEHNPQAVFFYVGVLVYLMWSEMLYLTPFTDVSKTKATWRRCQGVGKEQGPWLRVKAGVISTSAPGKAAVWSISVFRISGIPEAEAVQIRHVLWGFEMLLLGL